MANSWQGKPYRDVYSLLVGGVSLCQNDPTIPIEPYLQAIRGITNSGRLNGKKLRKIGEFYLQFLDIKSRRDLVGLVQTEVDKYRLNMDAKFDKTIDAITWVAFEVNGVREDAKDKDWRVRMGVWVMFIITLFVTVASVAKWGIDQMVLDMLSGDKAPLAVSEARKGGEMGLEDNPNLPLVLTVNPSP